MADQSSVRRGVSKQFTVMSFVWRFLGALAVVFLTYNPSGYSYFSWILPDGDARYDCAPEDNLATIAQRSRTTPAAAFIELARAVYVTNDEAVAALAEVSCSEQLTAKQESAPIRAADIQPAVPPPTITSFLISLVSCSKAVLRYWV